MKLRSRFAPLLLAGVVALGIAVVPAAASDAATTAKVKTGTIAVQFVGPNGKAIKKSGLEVVMSTNHSEGSKPTNKKGVATFTKVPAGSGYSVGGGLETKYVPVFKKVKVVAGKTTKVTLKIAIAPTISGTVLDADGEPIADIPVSALDKNGEEISVAFTSAKGTYKLTGLKTASYRVGFNAGVDFDDAYTRAYWKNGADFADATVVKVAAQTAKKAAVSAAKISGVLEDVQFGTVSGALNVEGAYEAVFTNVETLATYYGDRDTESGFSVVLPVGTYFVSTRARTYDEDENAVFTTYFYTGDDVAASSRRSDAVLIDVTADAEIDIVFGDSAPQDPNEPTDPNEPVTAELSGSVDISGVDYVFVVDLDGNTVAESPVVDGTFSAVVDEGTYLVEAASSDDDFANPYWYTGDDEIVSTDSDDALEVEIVDGEGVDITFGGVEVS